MNTPRISQELYDELQKSTPFITGYTKGDPNPKEQEFEVRLKFQTLKQSQDFHDKLCRFATDWITDKLLISEESNASQLADRISIYLQSGGLFNPELANHDNVRDLLIECRDELQKM